MPGIPRPSTVPWTDAQGRVARIPRETWRSKELPAAVEHSWTEPDALARIVECAVDAGAHADVIDAAEHLSRIDPDRDRRYGLSAIVFARNGLFRRASELLDRQESLYGVSTYGLHARAELALSGNRRAQGLELLRRALRVDPDASRPLRRLIDELSREGVEPVDPVLAELASARGSWRARLWLASHVEEVPREIDRLVRTAVEESRDERDVLSVASSVLARRSMTGSLVDFVAPRYQIDRDRSACGVNVLFGLLAAGAKARGEALLQRLGTRLEGEGLGEYAEFYRSAFRDLRERAGPETAAEPEIDLLRAMAHAVRQPSRKARQSCWRLLAEATLLVPVERAWIDVPIFANPWPEPPAQLDIVTGVDSAGQEVAIAFTDPRTLRAWGPMRSPTVPMPARALLQVVSREKGCAIVINPAGPTATELALPDIEAFLDGRAPAGEESRIRFLAEPLRRPVPPAFLDAAAGFLRESGIVRQAILFEMVDDRSGVNPAIAVEFVPEAGPSEQRALLLDGTDEVRWDRRGSRRIRFVPLEEGQLADYLRASGLPIPLD